MLQELIDLSNRLGESGEFVILGEGNTSANLDADRFYVKVSGSQLQGADEGSFVLVDRGKILAILEKEGVSDEEVGQGLLDAVCDDSGRKPSVETMFHAYLLSLPDVNFVAHTHPTTVNTILCSTRAEELVRSRLFPDEIVCCGPEPVFIHYEDPGHLLARKIVEGCEAYMKKWGSAPRSILMQNHGLIVLGKTSGQVQAATRMWHKTAQILVGAALLGGANYLSDENVRRISSRQDEKEREKVIFGDK
ncbi:MAG: class II aldolase/adducin family protein [Firmicutes bacterium]|nr:class II aldolase/adducin family protein [Bacillota bacterium]